MDKLERIARAIAAANNRDQDEAARVAAYRVEELFRATFHVWQALREIEETYGGEIETGEWFDLSAKNDEIATLLVSVNDPEQDMGDDDRAAVLAALYASLLPAEVSR